MTKLIRSAMPCPICGRVIEFEAILEADGQHAIVPEHSAINVHLHTVHPGQKVPRDERLPKDEQVAPEPQR